MSVLTYVYALVRAEKRPALRGPPAPMPGGEPVRLLPAADGLWLVVSTVPAQAYDQAALEAGLQDMDWLGPRAVAHEAVVECFLSCPALLPMQLFTLFTSDERAVEHVLRTHESIERILQRIERHVEWGLRLTWDDNAARAAAQQRPAVAEAPTGAAYLARKRDLLEADRTQLATAREAAERLYRTVEREAAASRRHGAMEDAAAHLHVLVDAAFLVRADRAGAFRTLLRRQARILGEMGVAVSLTGPWPPYNFI